MYDVLSNNQLSEGGGGGCDNAIIVMLVQGKIDCIATSPYLTTSMLYPDRVNGRLVNFKGHYLNSPKNRCYLWIVSKSIIENDHLKTQNSQPGQNGQSDCVVGPYIVLLMCEVRKEC